MAEEVGARCGRRKQRNPKRKNAENDDNLEGSIEKTDKELAKPKFQAICNGLQKDTENSCQRNKMVAADTSAENDSQSPVQNGQLKGDKTDLILPNIPNTTEKSMLPEDEDQDKKSEHHSSVMSSDHDDPINEFLNRSDTAVIYPEPVSDQDEDDNSHSDSVGPPEEELTLRCLNCSDSFTKATLLQDHMHAHHPDQPIKYLCPKCDETFLLKKHLDKHLALHSTTSQVCRVCNKTFANVYRLQRHMISHDESNDLRKFKCLECGKAFKFKHHLKEHIRIHSGEKPFECPNCGKRFSHSGSYSSHMTSKKCWIVGVNKNHQIDRTGNTEPNLAYTAGRTPVSIMDSPLQSPPPGSYPQYLPFDPRKTAIPAYYSAPTSNIHNYVSPYIYPVRHSVASSIIPVVSGQSLTESLHRPFCAQSPFIKEPATQISPDVNSNTELLSIQGGNVSTPIKITASPKIPAIYSAKHGSLNDSNKDCEAFSDGFPCRYCGSGFQSPIDQHQHERYLCKLNKDITPLISRSDSARNSPNSEVSEMSRHDIMNGSLSTGTDEEEEIDDSGKDDNNSGENKKLRERSLISDEQLQILKTYYQLNPRPRKFELVRIGNEIGFQKRVVQVWFQNMRARDRKKGKNVPYFPSMARFKIQEESSINWKDGKTKSNYIPVVPQPYAYQPKLNGQFIPCQTPPSRCNSVATSEELDQPLDLSIKKLPPTAHSSNSSFLPTPPNKLDEQVLNLSVKSDSVVERKSRPEGSLQDSAIYKYMQQEGLFYHPQFIKDSRLLSSQSFPNAFVSHTCPKTSLPEPIVVKSEIKTESPKVKSKPDIDQVNSKCYSDTQSIRDDSDIADAGPLVIDESEHVDDREKYAESQNVRTMLENIRPKIEQYLDLGNMAKATENLATLAEVSLAAQAAVAALTNSKPKRLRKKTWRQVQDYMESEEVELELAESCSVDDGEPLRKKRKSWKGHRLDVEDGLYSCDQCDKLFSKQSSLARHKYEHSGARPFQCEICTKAFKHKHHLTEHRRLHTGDKPFQCKKCGKRFSHSGSYSQHMNHRYKYCKPIKGDGETETDSSYDECTNSKMSLFEG